MQSKVTVLVVCLCGVSLLRGQSTPPAQTTTPPAQTTTPPAQSNPPAASGTSSSSAPDKSSASFVRRFSAGATLSVLALSTIRGGTSQVTNSTSVSTDYTTSNSSSRIGYGITLQAGLTDHFAVAAGIYYRKIGYQFGTSVNTITNIVSGGIVIPTTSTTSTHDDTRAHLFDVPFVLRYYGKSRHTPGPRWFVEAGGAWRDATSFRTSEDSTDASGVQTCCTSIPTTPAHRNARGFVAGAGLQFIDPFGIRVVPEVRYTRWVNQIFDAFTTHTQQNQIEANFTLSF
jgi:hypothetical protein